MIRLVFILLGLVPITNLYAQMEKTERYHRGWEKLQEIDGEAGQRVINSLEEISPELARAIIEYSFGEIYCLPTLDNKSKEVVAISSLIAQGAIPQLKVHLNGALNCGCSIGEVKEIILQMSVYTGFPKCINAMNALKEVLHERIGKGLIDPEGEAATNIPPDDKRYATGSDELRLLSEQQERLLTDSYGDLAPELIRFTIEYGYGDIFSRNNLSKRYRQIATISALATLGTAQPQLAFHIAGALNIGVTKEEIKEIMLLLTVYAGFPAAINGMNRLKDHMS